MGTRRLLPFGILALGVAVIAMLVGGAPIGRSALAQDDTPAGVIAFVGADSLAARIYLLDVTTGQMGTIDTPVLPEADLAWQPGGTMLAFTTTGGNYGVLTAMTGCFTAPFSCTAVTLFDPAEPVLGIEWTPDGAWLLLLHEDSIEVVRPVASSLSVALSIEAVCGNGLLMVGGDEYLLCAEPGLSGTTVSVNRFGAVSGTSIPLELVREVGTYPAITAMALNGTGHVVVGTSEAGGESGWVSAPDSPARRISPSQIHIASAGFTSDQLALAAAVADSTGDATLRDGDRGELFLYDFATGALTQAPGFTGATSVATVADSSLVLVVLDRQSFAFFSPSTLLKTPVTMSAMLPGIEIIRAEWHYAEGSLPPVPAATSAPPPTIPPPATIAPPPTIAPLPTFTPYIVVPPTPAPTVVVGVGCQFAIGGEYGPYPFAVGDTAEVTPWGIGLRLRSGAGRSYPTVRQLPAGTRMTVLSGPVCMDGYRWWQFRLTDGTIGWAADSDTGGWWTVKTTTVAEVINFWADRTSINSGECVTLQWAVEGIREVYYLGSGSLYEGVTGSGSRSECPTTTTTYTLRVIKIDGTTTDRSVTITVNVIAPVLTVMPVVTIALPDRADLYVSEFSLTPATPVKGSPVAVRVGVYNQGSAPAGPFHVDWYPGEHYGAPACSWDVASMSVGGGRILTCDYAGYPSFYPSINTMVKVDTANTVLEYNETNNTYLKAITVVNP